MGDAGAARWRARTREWRGEAAFQMLVQGGKESWHTKSFRKSRKTPALVHGTAQKFRIISK